MSINIVVPELSESVVEATVAEWLKNEGDPVEAGEAVVVLETDKVSLEVTAEQAGVLGRVERQAGEDVAPGDVLGVIDEGATAAEGKDGEEAAERAASVEREAPKEAKAETEVPEKETQPVAPGQAAANGQRATPVARRMAAEHGVDLTEISPSGGKITKDDIEKHLGEQPAEKREREQPKPAQKASAPEAQPSADGHRREERIRMSRRRRTIAQRLVEAQRSAAMLTTFNEIDMQAVMDVRKRHKEAFKEKHGVSLGLSSFFVKASIGALKEFPRVNAEIEDNEIILKHYYDIGIAIGAEEGLIVPVLRDADRMSFGEIEQQIRAYVQQVDEGTISIDALRGGTFTITNGGIFGSMLSTPILNPPQVGILGLHAIRDRPHIVDGEIVIRPIMYVALSYDHRIVDGREAVQFLFRVKELVEDPETLLLEG